MTLPETSICYKSNWNILLFWGIIALCMPLCPVLLLSYKRHLKAQKGRKQLPGKVVLITGASSGLGESLAHVFYKSGCKVILAARRVDELERVKKDLLSLNIQTKTHAPSVLALDLAQLNDIPNFASNAWNLHNQIDILINNGGISVRSSVESCSIDVDIKIMNVNYLGAVSLTKALLPSMIKCKSGHICFISSVQGKFALPHRSSYSASKHALTAFSDSLRAEVASKGIEVSCFSLGYIQTQLSMNALTGIGERHGKMDPTTASGMTSSYAAHKILEGILRNDKDVLIGDMQVKVGHALRFLCPSLYFKIMEKRALKEEKNN